MNNLLQERNLIAALKLKIITVDQYLTAWEKLSQSSQPDETNAARGRRRVTKRKSTPLRTRRPTSSCN